MKISQSFVYEKSGDGAVILRCFLCAGARRENGSISCPRPAQREESDKASSCSIDGIAEIPETLDQLPVRELAPYAFSAHMDERVLEEARRSGILPDLPALCGSRLKAVVIPKSVRRVGRYCFYGCDQLGSLEFSGSLTDWGSGAFAGCRHIKKICADADPGGPTGLRQVLEELPEALLVEFSSASAGARLIFPEFYEEGVENTPARILENHVHGTGILYRNCFEGKCFDFSQYDALFPFAKAREGEELLTELVLGRLRCPFRLEARAKEQYETYVREHLLLFGTHFLKRKDPEGLQWFLEQFTPERQVLEELSSAAARAADAQMQSILMDFRHKNFPGPTHRKRLTL